jgi:ATP-dependent helicase/nuclease subunit A
MSLTPGQQECVDTFGVPVVVAAGAGSGKTFTLTKRIVNAFDKGVIDDIGQVLAITFTDKAASELKGRVKRSLRAAGRIEQALKVDDAWISTIHGMCSRILREHALEIGIDPQFRVLPGDDAERMLADSIDDVLGQVAHMSDNEGDAPGSGTDLRPQLTPESLDSLVATYGMGKVVDAVGELVHVIQGSPRGKEAIVLPPHGESDAVLLQRALDQARKLRDLVEGQKESKTRNATLDRVNGSIDAIEAVLSGPSGHMLGDDGVPTALELVAKIPINVRNFGTREYKDATVEIIEELCLIMSDLRQNRAAPHLRTLVELANRAAGCFAKNKLSHSYLDNDDLIVRASRALDDFPDIAAQYANRFKLVMVDEFQDTDQLQVDMISRMAGANGERLCVVGDAQQSIYRFRGADVSVYQRHLKAVESSGQGKVIRLFDNFRSHGDVLSLVDRIFEQPEGFGRDFNSLVPARDETHVSPTYHGSGPRVDVCVVTGARSDGARIGDVRREQANAIADRFAKLRSEGHRAGDMVILLSSMTNSELYAQALRDRGFAAVIAKGSVFKETPEAKLMVSLARALSDLEDAPALLDVLSSDLFGLDARDLAMLCFKPSDDKKPHPSPLPIAAGVDRLCKSMSEKEPYASREKQTVKLISRVSSRAKRAAKLISHASWRVKSVPLFQVMEDVLVDSGWLSRMEARGAEGQASAGNALKAIRMVEGIYDENHCGPRELADRFEQRLELAKEPPGALSANGGDFVRIMTIHSSKGLQFPIVAISEVSDGSSRSGNLITSQMSGLTHVSLDIPTDSEPDFEDSKLFTSYSKELEEKLDAEEDDEQLMHTIAASNDPAQVRAALSIHEKREEMAEANRLLYVAITRAKESVILMLSGMRTKDVPNGCSKGKTALVQSALFGPAGQFEAGETMCETKPGSPVHVEVVELPREAPDADEHEEGAKREATAAAQAAEFFLPNDVLDRKPNDVAFKSDGRGLLSYSMIKGAVDKSDDKPDYAAEVVRHLSEAGRRPEATSLADVSSEFSGKEEHNGGSSLGNRVARIVSELNNGKIDARVTSKFSNDDDDATDFGSAFHLLAQISARAHHEGEALAEPSPDKVEAVCESYELDFEGVQRLEKALERWFASSTAMEVASHPIVDPECPFAFEVSTQNGPEVIEGFIDLFAADEDGVGRALVVDYKTGGWDNESTDRLVRKHALQGACYATAVLGQGYSEVELRFVRVEHGDDDTQTVSYLYTASDLPWLRSLWGDLAEKTIAWQANR